MGNRVQATSRRQRGQATVELLATLPLLVLLLAAAWQLVRVGHAWWMAGTSARVAARAAATAATRGDDQARRATLAARSALPPALRDRVVVSVDERAAARVDVLLPLAWPAPAGGPGIDAARLGAELRFER